MLAVTELFHRFCAYKQLNLSPQTFAKYTATKNNVSEFFRNKSVPDVSETMAEKFRGWLSSRLEPVTVRERIAMMQACWLWAIKKKMLPLANENPWLDIKVSLPPRQQPQPFTAEEISKIIREFRSEAGHQPSQPELSHYADYV